MAGKAQYVARHKRTGIEVSATYPTGLSGRKLEAVKEVTEGLAHLLGQLESAKGMEQQAVMRFMAEMLKSVDHIVADLRREGSYKIFAAIIDAGRGMQGPTFQFSKN